MRTSIVLAVAAIAGTMLFAQQQQKGAKTIFLDTQSGRTIMAPVAVPGPKPGSGSVQVPAITGLMYYLELVSPTGELTRVNTNRIFHSGEKFRLHVTSNIDGSLTILQSQEGAKFEKLLPTASLPSNVRKGVDIILPSADGWFRFDERPGEIRLLMMLSAQPLGSPAQVASNQDLSPEFMRGIEKMQQGSKALLIETSNSIKEACEVQVVNSNNDRRLTPGQIVVELKLQHRAKV